MPVYTYECNDCGAKFDILFGKEELRCKKCKSKKVKRLLSSFSMGISGSASSSGSSCPTGTCPLG